MKLLTAFGVLAAQVLAIFEQDGVTHLNSNNWANVVENDDENVWMVTFYADWCPYCKTWDEELSSALADPKLADKRIKFGAVNVMESRDLTRQFGIKRSPTVKVFGVDKLAPEDYLGHRKHADVVQYCDDYCNQHDYIIVPVIEYEYNVDAIVQAIADAHESRVNEANSANQSALAQIEEQYEIDIADVKADFEQQLKDLIAARTAALSDTGKNAEQTYNATKSEHASRIANLDAEAIEVIESVIDSSRNG